MLEREEPDCQATTRGNNSSKADLGISALTDVFFYKMEISKSVLYRKPKSVACNYAARAMFQSVEENASVFVQ